MLTLKLRRERWRRGDHVVAANARQDVFDGHSARLLNFADASAFVSVKRSVKPAATSVQKRSDAAFGVAEHMARQHREAADPLDLERGELPQQTNEGDRDSEACIRTWADVDDDLVDAAWIDVSRRAEISAECREIATLTRRYSSDAQLTVGAQRRRERGVTT